MDDEFLTKGNKNILYLPLLKNAHSSTSTFRKEIMPNFAVQYKKKNKQNNKPAAGDKLLCEIYILLPQFYISGSLWKCLLLWTATVRLQSDTLLPLPLTPLATPQHSFPITWAGDTKGRTCPGEIWSSLWKKILCGEGYWFLFNKAIVRCINMDRAARTKMNKFGIYYLSEVINRFSKPIFWSSNNKIALIEIAHYWSGVWSTNAGYTPDL